MASTAEEPSTQTRIRDAAARLFYEVGYHAATTRSIAKEVGIKAGSLYNHYAGKEDILFEVAFMTSNELLVGGKETIAAHRSARDRLRALIVFSTIYHAEHRFQARVTDEQAHALSPERLEQVNALIEEWARLFDAQLDAGRSQHGWQVSDLRVTALGIRAMCAYVDVWFREDAGGLTPQQVADIYGDLIIGGLER